MGTIIPSLGNQIVHLSEEFMKNPMIVLKNFFADATLTEIRQDLWAWLHAALTSNDLTYNSPKERGNLLFLYGQLSALIEANYLLIKQTKKGKRKNKAADFEGL